MRRIPLRPRVARTRVNPREARREERRCHLFGRKLNRRDGRPSIVDISTILAERYVAENVQPFLSAPVPLDPTFISDVEWLLGGWIVGKGLDAAYDHLKKRLQSRAYKARLSRNPSVQMLVGEGSETTAVRIRGLRPFMKVPAGRLLVMSKLSILYEGSQEGIFEIEESPGVILSDVEVVEDGTKRGRQIKAASKKAQGLFEEIKVPIVLPKVPEGTKSLPIRLVAGSTKYLTWWPRVPAHLQGRR